jgi:hypothetical protein
MLMILLLIVIFGIIALIEAPWLIYQRMWGELVLFACLLLTGFVLALIQVI